MLRSESHFHEEKRKPSITLQHLLSKTPAYLKSERDLILSRFQRHTVENGRGVRLFKRYRFAADRVLSELRLRAVLTPQQVLRLAATE